MPTRSFRLAVPLLAALIASPLSAQQPTPQPGEPPEAATQPPAAAAPETPPAGGEPAPVEPEPEPEPAPVEPEPEPEPADGQAQAGPVIELPQPPAAPPAVPPSGSQAREDDAGERPERDVDMMRGLKNERLGGPHSSTNLGGYAELHYTLSGIASDAEEQAELDLHRLVLFLAHRFNPKFRFYAEVEVEHALAAGGEPGEVGVEQAYLDYLLLGDALGVRAGVVLVPMGIINQWHEPPIFHGVERPSVDRLIIPSTWREGGVGIFGEPLEGLRYEFYLVGGLRADGFSAQSGLRGGRQAVAEARADGPAITGRVEVEPALGMIAGLAGYFGLAGPNADLYDAAGEALDIEVPVLGVSVDARGRHLGVEARGELALFSIGETDELRQASDADGTSLGIDVASQLLGAYGELAYDVLYLTPTEQQLLPFVRLERYDTMASVEGRPATAADEAFGVTELVFGLTYRPIPQVAFKSDYIVRSPDGQDSDGQFHLGVGAMF